MTGLIIGGLLTGFATPTGNGGDRQRLRATGNAFIYRELPLKAIPKIIIDSAVSSAAILVLVGFANGIFWLDSGVGKRFRKAHCQRGAVGDRQQVSGDPADQPAAAFLSTCSWKPLPH
ncbi:MAG: hypothetical protein R3E95_03185 [Thiolinea sp.]